MTRRVSRQLKQKPSKIIQFDQTQQAYPEREIKIKSKLIIKNTAQEYFVEALRNSTITIGVGPAGTGKTFLATRVAIEKLLNKEVERIIITRPVVESGEKLGFLPGTLEEKIHPYLLPIIDCIEDHVGPTMTKKLLDTKRIEIAPLAYMRGRTFNYSYVILDEGQNATKEQMKMFITRLGIDSFMTINGDLDQSDLPNPRDNGLQMLSEKLVGVNEEISFNMFRASDIVRHPLIGTVLKYLDSPNTQSQSNKIVKKANGSHHPALLG